MKLFYALIILIFFQNCSFDNKTGIWKNENIKIKKNDDIFKEFKKISKSSDSFNKIIPVKKKFTFRINSPTSTSLLAFDAEFSCLSSITSTFPLIEVIITTPLLLSSKGFGIENKSLFFKQKFSGSPQNGMNFKTVPQFFVKIFIFFFIVVQSLVLKIPVFVGLLYL